MRRLLRSLGESLEFIILFFSRALLLWIVLPVAACCWVISAPYQFIRSLMKRGAWVGLRRTLRWSDELLTFCLEHAVTIGRPDRRAELGVTFPAWPPSAGGRDSLSVDPL
jgi:hypothetical protein